MPNPRKPAALKALHGTERADRKAPKVPIKRPVSTPKAPASISLAGRKEWKRLAPIAHGLGYLTAADVRAFELLCEILAMERKARDTIAADGLTTKTADGGLKAHPAIRILETANAQATRLLEGFGLLPKGRATIEPSPAWMPGSAGASAGEGQSDLEAFPCDQDAPGLDAYLARHPDARKQH